MYQLLHVRFYKVTKIKSGIKCQDKDKENFYRSSEISLVWFARTASTNATISTHLQHKLVDVYLGFKEIKGIIHT